MKIHFTIRMICTLILALFLFGACTVGYRARHNHYDDQHHQEMNHGDHGDHN